MSTKKHVSTIAFLVVCSFAVLCFSTDLSPTRVARASAATASATTDAPRQQVAQAYWKLPLSFEVNRGQTDARVKFVSRGRGYRLFLTSTEAVLALRKHAAEELRDSAERAQPVAEIAPALAGRPRKNVSPLSDVLRMHFLGANPAAEILGVNELPGRSNYFLGNDPEKWQRNVPAYAKVEYRNIYPGIDLVFYGDQHRLEYDFIIAPGANSKNITIGFENANEFELNGRGHIVLHTSDGEVRLQKPQVYQEVEGRRQAVAGKYVLKGKRRVGFEVATYDVEKPLIIDPMLSYSTYLGGAGDDAGHAMAVDSKGNAYIAGETSSIDFPTTLLASQTSLRGMENVFVTKIDTTKVGVASLVYSTYIGGSGVDIGFGIAVDSTFNAYVTGAITSTNFPITANPFQSSLRGGRDAFVTKLDPTGAALLYSSYLGGSDDDKANAIAVDSSGNAYVTGITSSSNFPTVNALRPNQTTMFGAFVSKIDTTKFGASSLVYSTYLEGSGSTASRAIAVNSLGNAYMTGETISTDFPTTPGAFQTALAGSAASDAFVTKLDTTKTGAASLVYSTYLGGTLNDSGYGIAVDSLGNAYVTGVTYSTDFPTKNPFQGANAGGNQGFVTKLNAAGSALVYSTYLGGSHPLTVFEEQGFAIAVDFAGSAYVAGHTDSLNFPTFRPFQSASGGGAGDAFVAKFDPSGTKLVYSTYLGGSGRERGSGIAVDAASPPNAYVTGLTDSTNFPTTTGAFQTQSKGGFDAFVVKYDDSGPDFGLTGADGSLTPSQTVAPGGTATYNLQVVPFNGFTGAVTISCTGAPATTTCMPPSSAVNVAGSAAAFSVSVSTTRKGAVPPAWPGFGRPRILPQQVLVTWILVLLCVVAALLASRRWKPQLAALSVVVFLCLLATAFVACGGSYAGGGGGGTPPGTYTLTVIGSNQATSRPVNLILVVNP